MKKQFLITIAFLLTLSLAACSSPSDSSSDADVQNNSSANTTQNDYEPFTLTTFNDSEITFTKVPEKILSTNTNTGEILMAMGLGDKIIGTCYNNAPIAEEYREEYESKPILADEAATLEIVLAAAPDFVYGRSSAFGEKSIGSHDILTDYDIPSLSSYESYLTGVTIDDLYQDFYDLGKIFQLEDRASEIVKEMETAISDVQDKIADEEPVKVFIYDAAMESGIYTPGNNFASELIRLAGGENVFAHLEKMWNTVSPETVVEANPDVIVINDYAGTTLDEKIAEIKNNPAFADIPAVKNDRIISITLPEVFASARAHETVQKFAEAFHPEAFEE